MVIVLCAFLSLGHDAEVFPNLDRNEVEMTYVADYQGADKHQRCLTQCTDAVSL